MARCLLHKLLPENLLSFERFCVMLVDMDYARETGFNAIMKSVIL